jgi:hypothetical protein
MRLISIIFIWIFEILSFMPSFGQYEFPKMKHRLILADEGNGKVHCTDLNDTKTNWSTSCSNRDMQLIGNDRLMVSDNGGSGYSELSLATGAVIRRVSISGIAGGVNSAFRFSNKEIYCALDGSPAKILKIDSTGKTLKTITLSLDASVRICRPTSKGSYIIGGKIKGMMCEFDSTGKKIWECNAGGEPYMALRLPNGSTIISNGYGGQMILADKQGAVIRKFPSDSDKKRDSLFWKAANPNFFAGFQILSNSNIVVSNWQGHGANFGASGFQLIEIDSGLTQVVAYWKQNTALISSLHGVIVLDNLDTRVLHSDFTGIMQPLSDLSGIADFPRLRIRTATSNTAPLIRVFDLLGRIQISEPTHSCFVTSRPGTMMMARKYVAIPRKE